MGPTDVGDGSGSGSAAGSGSGSASGDVQGGEIEMGGDEGNGAGSGQSDLDADLNAENKTAVKADAKTPKLADYRVSWKDIVIVIRKPFLKLHRTELRPFLATTMNDNIVRHYAIGGELSYYLTDVLAVGVEGQYYRHAVPRAVRPGRAPGAPAADRQPVQLERGPRLPLRARLRQVRGPRQAPRHLGDLLHRRHRRDPDPGHPARQVVTPAFTNIDISPNVGADMRFFLSKWLTVSAGIRDYVFVDKFEPAGRSDTMYTSAAGRQGPLRHLAHQQRDVPAERQLLAADLVRVPHLPLSEPRRTP